MRYSTPVLTDQGNVIAQTLGTIVSTTHEPLSTTSKAHIAGAPLGKTIEPNGQGGFVTEAETLNDSE